jgi:methionine sulfoxide reductase heme-binding subunit
MLAAAIGLVIVFATDQIVPATSQYQAQMRIWLAGRATGVTALLLLTALVSLGLVLSHPVNQTTWKLSKRIFPWHENLFVFVVAFVAVHAVSLAVDSYAGVGFQGMLVPGLSHYRSIPVALGSIALYALLLTALTARYTRMLPTGWWLRLHRLSLVVFVLSWTHGILSGSDSVAIQPLYVVCGVAVLVAASYRYWVTRRRRPSFVAGAPSAGRGEPPGSGPAP